MLSSFIAISSLGLALAEQEATGPVVLWDDLDRKPAILQLARGGNDRTDPFAGLKKKRAVEQAKRQAKEKPKPVPIPAQIPLPPAGES